MLRGIRDPDDVRALPIEQMPELAQEIRAFLVEKVSATGGHLGPNLGVVELTIALHRIFRSPQDVMVWDTGHQAYVHKMLTGRIEEFDQLRQQGGLSGYPSRTESVHDVVENSHASTSLSYADGIAKAWEQRGLLGTQHVVAIIGDGGLTGGMAWEALNNIAGSDRQVVIVVNDNARSYSPTIGGLAHHLSTLRTTSNYERFMSWGKQVLKSTPVVGEPIYGTLHGMKKGLKDIVAPQGMFEDLGLKYVGPVDGHDITELEHALGRAKEFDGPVIVHVITEKGRGYAPAEEDEADRFHGVGIIDPDTGKPLTAGGPSWTGAFADELVRIGHDRRDVVAITAAMLGPTGLDRFAAAFPSRTYDVGIAEQHAVTSAAGLAFGGMHPVVALYATFLNRAFDQVLMDCALHHAGVTFVLDRAGVTGDDGASHNGMWDLSMLQIVPGLRMAAPRDETTLREELREAIAVSDAPTVVRFPKGALGPEIPATRRLHGLDVLAETGTGDVLIVSVGSFATIALEVAERLKAQGIGVIVVDPRWVKPLPGGLVDLASEARLVVILEDGVRQGGVGSAVSQLLRDHDVDVPVRNLGVPVAFLEHAKRAQVLIDIGLTAQEISRTIVETWAKSADLASDMPASAP
ncbi:MAG: 1-deoxy-D-xylulose-5-phosphate synthase [Actinobacteria bacterium]|nr:1-deoxy-D-xylulose-5-phosphate synthase [Actinomycetota bacterium]MSY94767.1 1-deoxy-D-xylulose-5-phosphate synthase [Actinomycetota bacterium]